MLFVCRKNSVKKSFGPRMFVTLVITLRTTGYLKQEREGYTGGSVQLEMLQIEEYMLEVVP